MRTIEEDERGRKCEVSRSAHEPHSMAVGTSNENITGKECQIAINENYILFLQTIPKTVRVGWEELAPGYTAQITNSSITAQISLYWWGI